MPDNNKQKEHGLVLSVRAHPDNDSFCAALHRSFNSAFTNTSNYDYSTEGHARGSTNTGIYNVAGRQKHPSLLSIDLYAEDFEPVMDLPELRRHIPINRPASSYIEFLQQCRELVLFFPDWWGAEPAILKGFFDRLFRQGIAYNREELTRAEKSSETWGRLNKCNLSVWICSDTSSESLSALKACYEQRFRSIVDYCGMISLSVTICSPVYNSVLKTRKRWLRTCYEVAQRIVNSHEIHIENT